jgi:hypothetical protein
VIAPEADRDMIKVRIRRGLVAASGPTWRTVGTLDWPPIEPLGGCSPCRSVEAGGSGGGRPIPAASSPSTASGEPVAPHGHAASVTRCGWTPPSTAVIGTRAPTPAGRPRLDQPVRNRGRLHGRLHQLGWAHSVETWTPDGELVGGLYGVGLGGLFAGESMFQPPHSTHQRSPSWNWSSASTTPAATLLDVQWTTDHLESLGAVDVPRAGYVAMAAEAVALPQTTAFC